MMESPLEKKRLQRAPSPARPAVLRDVFRDVHPRPAKPPVPKSPRIRGKTARQTPLLLSRRKEKPVPDRSVPRSTSTPTRKPNAVDTSPSNVFLTRNKRGQTRLYRTDSSSELSDCPSDPLSGGSPESACSLRGSTRRTDDLQREVEELRAENHYLKDEVEELRVEIEEMRDSYLEEEVYQLQELRRELDRANKNSRILQYRLRKAEQKSLRVAQSGQVDGDLLRSLEQDLKVAKDVSVRLHNELECVENKRCRAEDENELLRQKIIEVEISKQALYNELERAKESSARRRGTRDVCRKSASQEDSADLRCQLQFCKEESALMRKKLAKTSREKDELEQELQEYKRVYGDADGSLSLSEPELKLRLKLVEEEATILGRKVVELEVETHGLRAENEDLRSQFERDPLSSVPSSPYGDSPAEMRRHLQFVEEEAELLRRSIAEIEDHNKQLTSELNRFKFGPASEEGVEPLEGVVSSGSTSLREELKAAGMQISELSSKVLKLQYENRVLMSNVQRCDLASHLGTRGNLHTHGESQEDMQTHGGSQGTTRPVRQGPVGGENEAEDTYEKTSGFSSEGGRGLREGAELLNGLRREAEVLSHAVDRLIAETEIGGDTANRSMKAFRTELHIFMEKVEHLDEQHEDSTPHLTESSSFLSSVTNMSRDSPVTTHRDISDTQLRDVAVRPDDEEECEVWTQERSLLQQELRLLRHNMAAVYVKLRWLLVSWRMGLRTRSGEESSVTECEALDTIPELRLLLDHTDSPGSGPSTHTPELGQHHKQAGENRRVLHALRTLLEEFRSELRDEEQRRCHLQQSYANERAGWEVQWAELKCHTRQSDEACEDSVMTREREEHRRVLAESHSTCMELRWRLQHGERRWNRERAELLERFHRDRQEWEWTTRELQHKLDNLQVEQSTSSPEGKGSPHRICSPQGSPHSPRTLLSSQTLPTSRSQSDPEPPLEDRPTSVRQKTSENLFLDALSLDPLAASQGTQRLSLKENLNEIQDRSLSAVHQADLSTGSLLRAKSICSMSEFQRLMDSSPFLPEKRTPSNGGGDEATPPLSPDDLKYIEEFNSKDWDIPPVDISMSPSGRPTDVWIEESELRTLSSPWLPSTSTCSRPSGLRWLPTNMSDDMKEVALSVRPAARPVLRDSACQTNRSTQTSPCLSVALQTDLPRCLTPKGGSTPVSSPSRRKVQYSPAVQAKFERQCCSPKYGSPKLPRRPPATKAEAPATRAATPATPQKGFSESAWARSTTTRDSPVHTTINDGLSSLFNIIDHSPVLHDALHRLTRSPSRCRSPSPIQLIVETQGEKNGETLSIRQDLSAPPGHTLAENAARILNRRLMEQMCSEERRLSASEGKNDTQAHVEDLPHSPAAPFLQSCFQRPARPANRRLPSRWATRSPSCSPNWSQNAGPSFSLSPPDSALEHNFV